MYISILALSLIGLAAIAYGVICKIFSAHATKRDEGIKLSMSGLLLQMPVCSYYGLIVISAAESISVKTLIQSTPEYLVGFLVLTAGVGAVLGAVMSVLSLASIGSLTRQ